VQYNLMAKRSSCIEPLVGCLLPPNLIVTAPARAFFFFGSEPTVVCEEDLKEELSKRKACIPYNHAASMSRRLGSTENGIVHCQLQKLFGSSLAAELHRLFPIFNHLHRVQKWPLGSTSLDRTPAQRATEIFFIHLADEFHVLLEKQKRKFPRTPRGEPD
jgi:hypothetical protein